MCILRWTEVPGRWVLSALPSGIAVGMDIGITRWQDQSLAGQLEKDLLHHVLEGTPRPEQSPCVSQQGPLVAFDDLREGSGVTPVPGPQEPCVASIRHAVRSVTSAGGTAAPRAN